MRIVYLLLIIFLVFQYDFAFAKLNNSVWGNKRQYGKELDTKQFSDHRQPFTGKITYQLPYFKWNVEVIYTKGSSYSETARSTNSSTKKIISISEANTIADSLFSKDDRGLFKKQIANARFTSYFFENGVVSFEHKLDSKGKTIIGIEGIRTLLYQDGKKWTNDLMVNAYH